MYIRLVYTRRLTVALEDNHLTVYTYYDDEAATATGEHERRMAAPS